jgi:GrpB-like predicted nucleotidyltransferase (UPF0157 family)
MSSARQVVVAEYDEAWPARYEELRALLVATLGGAVVAIEHIGSTAVPGSAAKPIIDIDVAVADYSSAHELRGPLEAAGFRRTVEGDLPDRQFYVRDQGGRRSCHLSLTFLGGDTWLSHQALLARLRNDPDARREYADVKRRLAALNLTPEAYAEAKTEVIQRLLGHGWRKSLPRSPLVSRRVLVVAGFVLVVLLAGIGLSYYTETSRGGDGLPDHRSVRAADLAGHPEATLFYPGSKLVSTVRSDQSSDPGNPTSGPAKIDTLLSVAAAPDTVTSWYDRELAARGWRAVAAAPAIAPPPGEFSVEWRRGRREFFELTLHPDHTYRVAYLVGTGR